MPGAGYWVIGEKTRAKALFAVTVVFCLLAWLELTYGAVDGVKGGVFVPALSPFQWMPTLGAGATAGVGPVYTLFAASLRRRRHRAGAQPHPGIRGQLHHGGGPAELAVPH